MNTKNTFFRITALFCGLMLTGCGGYHTGKLKNTVYRNQDAAFRLETPESFAVTDSGSREKLRSYQELKAQADSRGASDTFVCEYTAAASDCDITIFSEPNTQNDTVTAFFNRICNHLRDEETGFEVRDIQQISFGKAEFNQALIAAHARSTDDADAQEETHSDDTTDRTQLCLYVTEASDSFVYMLLAYPAGDAGEAQKQMLLDSIS